MGSYREVKVGEKVMSGWQVGAEWIATGGKWMVLGVDDKVVSGW